MVPALRHSVHKVCASVQNPREQLWLDGASSEETLVEGNGWFVYDQDGRVLSGVSQQWLEGLYYV